MKRCPKCGRTLDESMFGKNSSQKSGLQVYCKECQRVCAKAQNEKRKRMSSERNISRLITNNAVDDIFSLAVLKDIPSSIRKNIKIPKKLTEEKSNSFNIRSNIMNVLRRTQGTVHLSQIQIAYYRMYKEFIKSRPLSVYLNNMKKRDSNIINPSKGYYTYRKEN